MSRREPDDTEVAFYEGLVRTTAARIHHVVGAPYDFEDVCQELRLKVWQALGSYDPARSRQPRKGYVLSCVFNRKKDLLKYGTRRQRVTVTYIEDDERPLAVDAALDGIEDSFRLPTTVTEAESHVVLLLYLNYSEREIATVMGVRKNDIDVLIESVRTKLADWRPSGAQRAVPALTAAQRRLPLERDEAEGALQAAA